jgi:hypothetical protein
MSAANNITQKGLNDFTLKIIALGLMTIDHIYEFFSSNGIPIWFTWLGRLSAPLFFFTMAEGFFYTKNRITYVKRLYLFSVIMSLGKFIAWKIHLSNYSYPIVPNNIFETFFLIGINILLIEFLCDKNKKLFIKILLISLSVLFEIILPISVYYNSSFTVDTAQILRAFLPCLLLCEGKLTFVALGITFFYLRNNRKEMIILYSAFSLMFFPFEKFSFENALYHSYQWMMIFTIPLMLFYNGEKGHGFKYLFYSYYPSHIFLLFFITGFINSK